MTTEKILVSPGVEITVETHDWMPKDMIVISARNGVWAIKGNKAQFFTGAELRQMYRNALKEMGFYSDE